MSLSTFKNPSTLVQNQQQQQDQIKALIIGISGCSSSGKTTLARLLRDLFNQNSSGSSTINRTFILHQDDFYRPEADLPIHKGFRDWDCPEAIDISAMANSLQYIRSHGSLPPTLESKEDQNTVGLVPVRKSFFESMCNEVRKWMKRLPDCTRQDLPNICIVDGFLLYTSAMDPVTDILDLRLFLLVSKQKATQRRHNRDGYVTLEGFWKDPPGYVDEIVWPNYAGAHAWMFVGGDAEKAMLNKDALERKGVIAQIDKSTDIDMETTLEWAVHQVMTAVEKLIVSRRSFY